MTMTAEINTVPILDKLQAEIEYNLKIYRSNVTAIYRNI